MKRFLPLLVLTMVAPFGAATPAAAHPMSSFSMNHDTAITLQCEEVRQL